jgi:hypothetical protein
MRTVLVLAAVLGCALRAAPVMAIQIYLQADFNDKTLDAPIGTGGPAVGEPVSLSAPSSAVVVRGAPMPTPSLQITDDSDCCAAGARFEFLDDAVITDGNLVIRADLWIRSGDSRGYTIAVREQSFSAEDFLSLNFGPSGLVYCTDAGGLVGSGPVGSYQSDRVIPVRIAFDMEVGTYDVSVDGAQIVFDEPDGVAAGVGIGAVLFNYNNDAGVGDCFYVDNVFVANGDPTPAEAVSWGAIKAVFR